MRPTPCAPAIVPRLAISSSSGIAHAVDRDRDAALEGDLHVRGLVGALARRPWSACRCSSGARASGSSETPNSIDRPHRFASARRAVGVAASGRAPRVRDRSARQPESRAGAMILSIGPSADRTSSATWSLPLAVHAVRDRVGAARSRRSRRASCAISGRPSAVASGSDRRRALGLQRRQDVVARELFAQIEDVRARRRPPPARGRAPPRARGPAPDPSSRR